MVRALSALIKWGWAACDERQREEEYKIGTMPTGRLN